MECTKLNCPMQAGTATNNCADNCPWRTTLKDGDLISRAAAIEAFDDERVDRYYGDVSPESVIRVIESIPAVDAVPVVRCRDCKWWGKDSTTDGYKRFCPNTGCCEEPDFYCADGERMENEQKEQEANHGTDRP